VLVPSSPVLRSKLLEGKESTVLLHISFIDQLFMSACCMQGAVRDPRDMSMSKAEGIPYCHEEALSPLWEGVVRILTCLACCLIFRVEEFSGFMSWTRTCGRIVFELGLFM
jgi:hypothetical protein